MKSVTDAKKNEALVPAFEDITYSAAKEDSLWASTSLENNMCLSCECHKPGDHGQRGIQSLWAEWQKPC